MVCREREYKNLNYMLEKVVDWEDDLGEVVKEVREWVILGIEKGGVFYDGGIVSGKVLK